MLHAGLSKRNYKRRPGVVSAIVFAVILVAFVLFEITGVIQASSEIFITLVVLLCVLIAALLLRGHIPNGVMKAFRFVRPIVVICALPVGLVLLAVPIGGDILLEDPFFTVVNLIILAVILVFIYYIGQRTAGSVMVFLLICLILGLANYFLIMFKGSPLTPSDLLAISTAAEVASGYTFVLTDAPLIAIAIFVAYCIVLACMPKVRHTVRRVVGSLIGAVVLAVCAGIFVTQVDLEEACDHNLDMWDLTMQYEEYGTAYCFVSLAQDVAPKVPDGYSDAEAEKILSTAPSQPERDNAIQNSEDLAVIVVMNETFADLSIFPGLEDTDARPEAFYSVAEDSLEAGWAYVSVLGGGTCNSEYEFLTCSSMGFLGHVYPYASYDLSSMPNLAQYFSDLGFATHAIHPADGSNWNRDKVYAQMGFDDFADQTYFEGADTFRSVVSDGATYDYILDLLATDSGSQFIFDVTLQNHGGYNWGGIDEADMVHVTLPGGTISSELDEYLSCIKHSSEELAVFVDELNALDRPVVLCFFGDHQPSISVDLYEETHDGESPTSQDDNLTAWQTEHVVPYLIWANDAARGDGAAASAGGNTSVTTSLNFLGSRMLSYLPYTMTPYQRFVLGVNNDIPAINYFGYLMPDGEWYAFDDQTSASAEINDLAIVQYYDLFGGG